MPQTGAAEEKKGIQLFADAVKTESSKKTAGTMSFQAKEVTYLNPAKEEKKTVIDEVEQAGAMDQSTACKGRCGYFPIWR